MSVGDIIIGVLVVAWGAAGIWLIWSYAGHQTSKVNRDCLSAILLAVPENELTLWRAKSAADSCHTHL